MCLDQWTKCKGYTEGTTSNTGQNGGGGGGWRRARGCLYDSDRTILDILLSSNFDQGTR